MQIVVVKPKTFCIAYICSFHKGTKIWFEQGRLSVTEATLLDQRSVALYGDMTFVFRRSFFLDKDMYNGNCMQRFEALTMISMCTAKITGLHWLPIVGHFWLRHQISTGYSISINKFQIRDTPLCPKRNVPRTRSLIGSPKTLNL